jgi:hypothetical protein
VRLKMKEFDWSVNDCGPQKFLVDNYEKMTMRLISKHLGCSRLTVLRKAKKLGFESKHVTKSTLSPEFDDREIEIFMLLAGLLPAKEIAFILSRTHESVKMFGKRNAISFRVDKHYTKAEDEAIAILLETKSYDEIGEVLKRSGNAIILRARQLGLPHVSKRAI